MGGCVRDWEWMLGTGYTAVRIIDVVPLSSNCGWVAPGIPAFLLAQRSSGVTGAAELGALFWLAALRAFLLLLLLLRNFLGRDGVRGAPDGTLVVMADDWVSLVSRTVTETSRERTESLGIGARESLGCTGNSCPARRGGDGVGSGIQCMRLSYRGWVTSPPRKTTRRPWRARYYWIPLRDLLNSSSDGKSHHNAARMESRRRWCPVGVTCPLSAKRKVGSTILGKASMSCWIVTKYSWSPLCRSSRKILEKEQGSSLLPRHWL